MGDLWLKYRDDSIGYLMSLNALSLAHELYVGLPSQKGDHMSGEG